MLDLNDLLVESGLADFTRQIKLGQFKRSYDVARRTIVILDNLIKDRAWRTARELIDILKSICTYIDGLELIETAAGNMTRRIMRIIRDECQNFSLQTQQTLRATNNQDDNIDPGLDDINDEAYLELDLNHTGVKENILEGIEQELMNELELSSKSIAQQAIDYVQSEEIILTLGKSKIIESFLRHAAIGSKTGKRKFNVIVVELAPFYSGREMAKALSKYDIGALIVPDSAVFAIMSRVNKVIIGCHSMMANGGIKAPAGSHSVALAAKHYSVPLIVCCPMYKLTPEYLVSHDSLAFKHFSNIHAAFPEPYVPEALNEQPARQKTNEELNAPADQSRANARRPNSEGEGSSKLESASNQQGGTVESLHSTFDYVPPELITLFVSNIGGNSPSYVYQLLNELYHKSDYLD